MFDNETFKVTPLPHHPEGDPQRFIISPLPQPPTLSKNEYIALELTKSWCTPATKCCYRQDDVLTVYKYFRDELEKESKL